MSNIDNLRYVTQISDKGGYAYKDPLKQLSKMTDDSQQDQSTDAQLRSQIAQEVTDRLYDKKKIEQM